MQQNKLVRFSQKRIRPEPTQVENLIMTHPRSEKAIEEKHSSLLHRVVSSGAWTIKPFTAVIYEFS